MKTVYLVFILSAHFALIKGNLVADVYEVLPQNLFELDLSPSCFDQLQEFHSTLLANLSDETMWAWKMIDATSKLQSGILEGNLGNMGSFDECTRIKANTKVGEIVGKYCLGSVLIEMKEGYGVFYTNQIKFHERFIVGLTDQTGETGGNLPEIQWSACLPHECTAEDFTRYFSKINEYLEIRFNFTFIEELCQSDKDVNQKFPPKAITAIVIFAMVLILIFLSTIYDLHLKRTQSKPAFVILIAFSAYTNGSKLFSINSNNPDQLPCLNGLRVISIMWVVLGHEYSIVMSAIVFNTLDMMKWTDRLSSMYMIGATVSVDTFFVLSGLLMAYGFFKTMSKGTPFNVLLYWLHRYLRLTPALAAVVLVDATITEYFSSGPLWPRVKLFSTNPCSKYWWSALLYVQNYVNTDEICVAPSWYLSVDMQLFMLSPLILWPILKWKKIGLGWLCVLILASMAVPFAVAWKYDLAALFNFNFDARDFNTKYYMMTHTRATPWLVGIFAGYLIFKVKARKQLFRMNTVLVLIMWAACLSVLITCVFGGHSTLREPIYDKWAHVSYVTFVRPAWAIALTWLIFACITGYGGPVNWLLSFPVYQVLGRLSYSVYLLHATLMVIKIYSARVPHYFSDFNHMYSFWGTFMFSIALSVAWVLAFESPMITIEKVLFHKKANGKCKLNKIEPEDKC